jgi:protein arginine N-methyltransferase 1
VYGIADYGDMISNAPRIAAFAAALRQSVRSGSVVLDIGTGTGIMALVACQCGARRVHAVEVSEVIQLARDAARANGCADRIVFHAERSTELTLPDRADVIVSDLSGVLPPFRRHLADIADARERLLAPGGRMIAASHTLRVALVEAPELFRKQMAPWDGGPLGLDLSSGLRYAQNSWCKARVSAEQLLSEAQSWARLDYSKVSDPRVHGNVRLRVIRSGEVHGLAIWFDASLADGIGFSNAPSAPELIYGQGFFPWPRPVVVNEADEVELDLRADPVGDDYVWGWRSDVRSRDTGEMAARFQQSTFLGTPLAPEHLARRAATHVPRLSRDGELARLVLQRMDGRASLEVLAHEVARAHPDRFASWHQALAFVSDVSERYGR